MNSIRTRVCVVGGGPAGMMTGYLLARAGIDVVVLEKHKDFFRDFRGDTVHPSTLELLHELGLLQKFLQRPHQEATHLQANFNGQIIPVADFRHLPTHSRFIAFMPQWDFLNLIAEEAKHYANFQLKMEADVTGLIEDKERITGVRAMSPSGEMTVYADLVIGADGRHSVVRPAAKLDIDDIGAPIDVLWLALSRKETDTDQAFIYFDRGQVFVMINRKTYFQCGLVIEKGALQQIKADGLSALQNRIATMLPFLKDRVSELKTWDDIKLLTVTMNRLRQWWRPGLLCIGDAAHAMSPVGGVGINLAIQDAVAAVNILAEPLRANTVTDDHLRAVERRRLFPARATQYIQRMLHEHMIYTTLKAEHKITVPWGFRLLKLFPSLQRVPARIIGLGVRPEHIKSHVSAPD